MKIISFIVGATTGVSIAVLFHDWKGVGAMTPCEVFVACLVAIALHDAIEAWIAERKQHD